MLLVQVYAVMDPEVGYVQGMNYIAAFVVWRLQQGTEAEAFWLFYAVMRRVRRLFVDGMCGYEEVIALLGPLLRQHAPRVWHHFRKHSISMEVRTVRNQSL